MRGVFVTGFALGVAACLPPGVVFAEAMRRGLEGGFRRALTLELGSLVGDAAWAVAGLSGAMVFVRVPALRVLLAVSGCVLLARLSYAALRRRPARHVRRAGGDFATGAVISLANPGALAFWLAIGGSVAAGAPAWFLAGFLLACLLYCPVVSAVIASGQRLLAPRGVRALNFAGGVGLGLFAVRLASSALAPGT